MNTRSDAMHDFNEREDARAGRLYVKDLEWWRRIVAAGRPEPARDAVVRAIDALICEAEDADA